MPETCAAQTDQLVRPARCTKPANHYGERHTAEWPGLGSYTWGYLAEPDEKMELVEVLDTPAARSVAGTEARTAVDPKLKAQIDWWGLAKCVYAAAHDIDPGQVDTPDGGYGRICALINADWNDTLEPLARAVGLPDDAEYEYAEILERIQRLADIAASAGMWCNCQAIPGSASYPGPWHEKGGEAHYPCAQKAGPGTEAPAGDQLCTVDECPAAPRCSSGATVWHNRTLTCPPSPGDSIAASPRTDLTAMTTPTPDKIAHGLMTEILFTVNYMDSDGIHEEYNVTFTHLARLLISCNEQNVWDLEITQQEHTI